MTKEEKWFKSWFNSPYYHILYQHRDYAEAEQFMKNLVDFLQPNPNSKILDLACGKGRHSVFLNKMGLNVTGMDLSEESILHAKQFENTTLHFKVHDMQLPIQENFQYIFNLFTSFGYFDSDKEHLNTLQHIYNGLEKNGIFVLDFFNIVKTKNQLVANEIKILNGIEFKIKRFIKDGYVYKTIAFEDKGNKYSFQEKVRGFDLEDLKKMFSKANFNLKHIFGNFDLDPYNPDTSDRLILIASK